MIQSIEASIDRRCVFCEEFRSGLFEVNIPILLHDNFAVVADIAPVTYGHILVLPRTHVRSTSELSQQVMDELTAVVDRLRMVGQRAFGSIVVAEHGTRAGGFKECIDHAHLHLCPARVDPATGAALMERALAATGARLPSWNHVSKLRSDEYLLWSSDESTHSVWTPRGVNCSQLLRRTLNQLNNNQGDLSWKQAIAPVKAQQTAALFRYLLGRTQR